LGCRRHVWSNHFFLLCAGAGAESKRTRTVADVFEVAPEPMTNSAGGDPIGRIGLLMSFDPIKTRFVVARSPTAIGIGINL